MTKVYCADVSCKFNKEDGTCSLKKIALSWHSIVTVYNGIQDYNKCMNYEEGETKRSRELKAFFEERSRLNASKEASWDSTVNTN